MRLNADNELVQAIFAFVGPSIEQLRKELVEAQREQRDRRSQAAAQRGEPDRGHHQPGFDAFRTRLHKVKAATAGTGLDAGEAEESGGEGGDDDFLYGGDVAATVTDPTGDTGTIQDGGGGNGSSRRLNPIVEPDSRRRIDRPL